MIDVARVAGEKRGAPCAPFLNKKLWTHEQIQQKALHELRIIHRDIKPANIFMAPGNVVKVS